MESSPSPNKSKGPTAIKIVLVGSKSVGKTSIINRFYKNEFAEEYSATIGIDLVTKTIKVGENNVKIQLWDTAGQERFRCLIPSYIKKADAVIMVYDITKVETFNEIDFWMKEVDQNKVSDLVMVLVGNKADMTEVRQVESENGMNYAKTNKIAFVEASAKTGENIMEIFNHIVAAFTEPEPTDPSAPESNSIPQPEPSSQFQSQSQPPPQSQPQSHPQAVPRQPEGVVLQSTSANSAGQSSTGNCCGN